MRVCSPNFATSSQSKQSFNLKNHSFVRIETYKSQCSAGMLCRSSLDKHICLWRDYRRVDESKEKEATNERANGIVSGFRVFSLSCCERVYQNDMTHDILGSSYEFACKST